MSLGLSHYSEDSILCREQEGSPLAKAPRRKRRPAQNGVQAIFSGRGEKRNRAHVVAGFISTGVAATLWVWISIGAASSSLLTIIATLLSLQGVALFAYSLAIRKTQHRVSRRTFGSYDLEEEIMRNDPKEHVSSGVGNLSKKHGKFSPFHFHRITLVVILAGIMLTTVVGFTAVNLGSQHHTNPGTTGAGGTSGAGTSPSVKTPSIRTIAPRFYAVSNIAEATVSSNASYTGAIETNADDFIIVQIAYSQGSGGNLPDISYVRDTQSSIYTRIARAFPGAGANFWEQVLTGRASSTTNSTIITASPGWSGCQPPCVTSIIITMTIGRYRGVAEVGAWNTIAPNASSNSQSVSITATQANSTLVELLSHGAYSNCGTDAAQPIVGQTPRNCFTGTTERTELFDHSISNAQTYTESYTWAQVEVQRGIYLELKGNSTS